MVIIKNVILSFINLASTEKAFKLNIKRAFFIYVKMLVKHNKKILFFWKFVIF